MDSALMVLGFLGTVLVVTGLIHLYLWKRLVRDITRRGRGRRVGTLGFVMLALLIPATMVASRLGGEWIAWPGFFWLSVMFYLFVLTLVLEIPMLVAKLVLRRHERTTAAVEAPEPALVAAAAVQPLAANPAAMQPPAANPAAMQPPAANPAATDPPAAAPPQPDHDPSRRLLLARGAAIFAGLTAVGVTGYGVRTALGPPVVKRVPIPLSKLGRGADGLRIALVADIHLGPILGRSHTERIVSVINGLTADVVAVVGDLVDGSVAELGPAAAPLRGLQARYGSFFVTGNHEYYSGHEEWIEEVGRLGLRPLRNERLEIVHGGAPLDLAGVNDVAGEDFADGPDVVRALDGRDLARPVILLSHQPVQIEQASRHGVDLQLSGHTHGGQMIPFNLIVAAAQPAVSGLVTIDGTQLYVTNGAGFWGPPVRVGVPPEITLIELRSA